MTVEEIVAKTVGVAVTAINDASGPESLALWDSASHIDIVLSVEAEFGVSFSADEVLSLLSVGSIKQALAGRGIAV